MGMDTRGIIAFDGLSPRECFILAEKLQGSHLGVKINDLLDGDWSAQELTSRLSKLGKVFVDIKGHDIPATIENRIRLHATNGADLITVHASGGVKMMRAAAQTYKEHSDGMGILAVTVLTSLSDGECMRIYGNFAAGVVERFAGMAEEAGVYGIVCSPKELLALKGKFPSLKRVTPGVRSIGENTHDQARVDTPGNAIRNGADILIIGRQVTTAAKPVTAVEALNREIVEAERSL